VPRVDASLDALGVPPGAAVVAGVSGGVDSTVLARLLHGAGRRVIVAHVNYGLRGAESDADQAFVEGLADDLRAPLHVRRARVEAGGNIQEKARDLRYRFFEEVAAAEGAGVVAVGSTQDDQAETVLLHLCRGSGPRGAAGMPAERPIARGSSVRLVRPLLDWSRAAVEAVARAQGWSWREDASNAGATYRRNALRHEVMPVLRRIFGDDVSARVAASAARVGAWAGAPGLLLDALEALGPGLPLASLRALPVEVRHGLYLAALERHAPAAPRTAAVAASIDRLLDAQSGRRVIAGPAVVWRDRAHLVVGAPAQPVAAVRVPPAGAVATPWGTLTVEPLDAAPASWDDDPHVAIVDAGALAGEVVLRPWAAGDTFAPLGGSGTKLVSDLLTDARVPAPDRAGQLVLTADDRIVWVVGHRLAREAGAAADRPAVRLRWVLAR